VKIEKSRFAVVWRRNWQRNAILKIARLKMVDTRVSCLRGAGTSYWNLRHIIYFSV
jgi:hypothetical protein